MALGYLAAPLAILLVIVAITLVSFGAASLRSGRKRQGVWMVIGGILVVGVPAGATAAWNAYQDWSGWEHTVSVQGLDPTGDPEFTVDIRHHQMGAPARFTYTFGDAGDLDAVRAEFLAQHPDGVAASDGPFVAGDLRSSWHVYLDGARYDLFDAGDGSFMVAAQLALVQDDASGEPKLIPFPSGSSPMSLNEVSSFTTDMTPQQWAQFYEPIGGATVSGSAIAVPTSSGGTATLTFDATAGTFTVVLTD